MKFKVGGIVLLHTAVVYKFGTTNFFGPSWKCKIVEVNDGNGIKTWDYKVESLDTGIIGEEEEKYLELFNS